MKNINHLDIYIENTTAEKNLKQKYSLHSKEKGLDEMKTTPCVEKYHPIFLFLRSLLYHSPSVNGT